MSEKSLKFINNHLVLVLTGVFLFRTGYLFVSDLDLIGDESYYWDWSRRPDWCYYSKPPMVAWLIAVFTGLGGDTTAVVRLPAVVLGTVFLGYFYATARAFYSAQTAALALLLMLSMPFNVLANFVMTIDPPLYCFWMMSLYYLHRALFKDSQSAWFWAGLSTGTALLSKQVAVLIPIMLICFLLLDRQRYRLFKREFCIYLLPVIVCLIPLLIWNYQHDWVMFGHSKGHFGIKQAVAVSTRLKDAGTFWLYQLLLATPVIFVLVLILSVKSSLRLKRLLPAEQFLMLMGPVLLLGILALSFLQKVQGNWPVPFYFSALILLSGQWQVDPWRKPLKSGLLLGGLMVSLTYVLPLLVQTFNWHHSMVDPTSRFRHWRELAQSIDDERHKNLTVPEQAFIMVVGHRNIASQLGFYLQDHPTVFRYEVSGLVESQYELWPGPVEHIGQTGFIISEQKEADIPVALKSAFEKFHQVGEVINPMKKNARYNLFLGENLLFWPPINSINK